MKWLVEFGVQIHANQANELLDMAAYLAKYHNASKNHGADFADVALVFLAARLKTPHIFTVDKADLLTEPGQVNRLIVCGWLIKDMGETATLPGLVGRLFS